MAPLVASPKRPVACCPWGSCPEGVSNNTLVVLHKFPCSGTLVAPLFAGNMEKTKIAVVSSRCPAQLFVASLRELSILASRRAQSLSSSWQASNELCVSDVKTFVRQALKGARFEGDGPLGNPEDPLSQNFFLKENARTNAVSMHAGGTLRITFGGQVLSDEIRLRDCVSTASQASFADDPSEPVRFYFDILPNAESASSVSENSTSSKPAHRAQFLTHNPMSMYHGHQFYPR